MPVLPIYAVVVSPGRGVGSPAIVEPGGQGIGAVVVPPTAFLVDCALVGVRSVVGSEVRPVVMRQVIWNIPLEPVNVQLEVRRGRDGEMVVAHVPVITIPILHVDRQDSVANVGQVINCVQSRPVFILWMTESVQIVLKGLIEANRSVLSTKNHCIGGTSSMFTMNLERGGVVQP